MKDRAALRAAMSRAVELAGLGAGEVEPNPRVGAVLLRRGRVVGEGRHRHYGGAHAEIEALRRAKGDTLVVTLEPCSTAGKTPACVEAIVRSGVKRVVWALDDPGPANGGRGAPLLRRAGIEVARGFGRGAARPLLRTFRRALGLDRPWVVAKWAMTLDGKIATAARDSRWVSGERSRASVHELRGRCDAVVTGIGTLLADDPRLTPRGRVRPRVPPWRVVFDSSLRTPPGARVLAEPGGRVLLLARNDAAPARERALGAAGAEVLRFAPGPDGRVPVAAALRALRERGVNRVLLESGGELAAAFFAASAVDQVVAFVAPKIAGGAGATTPVGGSGIARMADALRLVEWSVEAVGEDLRVVGFLG